MDLRFLSKNEHKIMEAADILKESGINLIPLRLSINEIQSQDEKKLVENKLLQAFTKVCKPLFLEHTGLYLENLNNYPGGLTESFWETLKGDLITKYFKSSKVIAKTTIGYCDGRRMHFFTGELEGKIADSPCGDSTFQWDTIFIPQGYDKTFANLEEIKNKISMRRVALNNFVDFLGNENER